MKRVFAVLVLLIGCVAVHAQVSSQRVIFTGSSTPTICVPGKVYTANGLNPAKAWTGSSTGACTPIDPVSAGLVTLTGAQELTNKTLTSSVGKGTWTASGTWTLPAFTLGGTISGNALFAGSNVAVGIAGQQAFTVNYNSSNAMPGAAVSATGAAVNTGVTVNNTDTSGGSAILFNVGDVNKGRVKVSNAGLMTLSGSGLGNDITINSAGAVSVGGTLAVTGNVTQTAKTTTYNNVTTAGLGVPGIYGAGRVTAQTAAASSIATYTVGAADGSFIVSANVNITTSTAHTFSIEVAYTDETNTARVVTFNVQQLGGTLITSMTNVTGAGPYEGVPLHIRAKASTAITIRTNAGGTYTTVTFNAEGVIQQIQ